VTKTITIDERKFEVEFIYHFEGKYYPGNRYEPEEFPDCIWEVSEVRDESGEVVENPIVLKQIEAACDEIAEVISRDCENDHAENLTYMQECRRGFA